jgi:hypothetical protein
LVSSGIIKNVEKGKVCANHILAVEDIDQQVVVEDISTW